jgi:hypothetical protein
VSATANPVPTPPGNDHRCPACSSTSLTRGRLPANEHDRVDLFACDVCGDFWFERAGTRLTAEAMRDLGFMP